MWKDFAGDGNFEMLIGAQHSVFLLQKNGTDYDQIWAYPFDTASGASITAVASGDVNGDGHREIFFSAGQVIVGLDGVTRREVARYGITAAGTSGSNSSPYCTSLKVADIDNDGIAELVCLGMDASYNYPATGRIYVFNAQTLQLKWMTDDLVLGTSMAVGDVDSDPALEIVTSGGYVFDGATGANQWAYAPGFGEQVDIGDVIGDGVGKIVGTAVTPPVVGVTAYDAVQKTVLWSIAPGVSGFSAIKVAKLDGTSPAEIIAADGAWGNVTVYRYTAGTPQVLTQINSIGDGVTAIATGDVNGDGVQEIVWTPTFSLTNGSPTVAISSWLTHGDPVMDRADAGSARWALCVRETGTGRRGAEPVDVHDAWNRERLFRNAGHRAGSSDRFFTVSQQVDSNWADVRACDVADVYGTGIDSVLLGTAMLYTPYLTAFDFVTGAKQWSSPQLGGSPIAVTHADVNGDGVSDLIAITTDGHLYAWDVRDQTLIWSVSGIGGSGLNVAVGDVYGDGNQEIIALTTTQVLVYTQGAGGLTQKASYPVSGTDLLVADTNGDGKAEIYVLAATNYLTNNATVYQLDGSLTLLNTYPVGSAGTTASSIYLEQSAFPRKNIVVSVGPQSSLNAISPVLAVIDRTSGTQIWQSPPLLGGVSPNSLNYYDLTGSGRLQMVFGTSVGMYVTQ